MAKVQYVTVTSDKKKWTAFWLCLFFGIIGAHYFYVGRKGKGILYCFTFGLLMIGWFHDLGTILKGRFKDDTGCYLKA